MTRSRLDTVRKVADLRRAGARSAVATATLARDAARESERRRTEQLGGHERAVSDAGPERPATAFAAQALGLSRLAGDVLDARRAVSSREAERDSALQTWLAASRHARLLESWCDRAAAAQLARAEGLEQRLLDDLASRRRTT